MKKKIHCPYLCRHCQLLVTSTSGFCWCCRSSYFNSTCRASRSSLKKNQSVAPTTAQGDYLAIVYRESNRKEREQTRWNFCNSSRFYNSSRQAVAAPIPNWKRDTILIQMMPLVVYCRRKGVIGDAKLGQQPLSKNVQRSIKQHLLWCRRRQGLPIWPAQREEARIF